MELPGHYRKYFFQLTRFALVMMVLALIFGFMMQESLKKSPYSSSLPPGIHWEAIYHLALLHGHVFLVGALIPLAVLFMLFIGQLLKTEPVSEKILSWGSYLYLPGASFTILLMLYKGYHFLLSTRTGQTNFEVIEKTFFGGNEALRHALYGISHTVMGVGLCIFIVGIWRALSKSAENTGAPATKTAAEVLPK